MILWIALASRLVVIGFYLSLTLPWPYYRLQGRWLAWITRATCGVAAFTQLFDLAAEMLHAQPIPGLYEWYACLQGLFAIALVVVAILNAPPIFRFLKRRFAAEFASETSAARNGRGREKH